MTDKKKKEQIPLDICTQAHESAEHARLNEPVTDACDDGRGGIRNQKKEEEKAMTDEKHKNKNEDGEDLVEERNKERQETMDKMSIDTSETHTYDKNKPDDGE